MMPHHHPSHAWLLDFAAGTSPALFDTVIRAHLGTCNDCRETVTFAERIGGELLGETQSTQIGLTADDICNHYEQHNDAAVVASRATDVILDGSIENVVGTYLDSSIEALPWRRIGSGLDLCRLAEKDGARMWMLRGQAGTVLPEHTHGGGELTLVLKGAYFCGSKIYRAGDIEDADEETRHQPVITDDGECICLAVTEGKLQFSRWLPKAMQPFIGI